MKPLWVLLPIILYSNSALGKNHILDPYGLVSSKTDSTNQNLWLRSFYKEFPFLVSLKPQDINDGFETLDEKTKRASQNFLELRMEEAAEELSGVFNLLKESLPFVGLYKKITELKALEIMIKNSLETPSKTGFGEAHFFQNNPEFLNRLPLYIRKRIENSMPIRRELQEFHFPVKPHRIFVYGKEMHLPVFLPTGVYLVHFMDRLTINASWIEISETSTSPIITALWSKEIWKIYPDQSLRKAFLKSRPSHLSEANIIVLGPKSDFKYFVKVPERVVQIPLPLERASTMKVMTEQELERPSKIFSSPWFWILTGAALGTGGFMIYEATRNPVEVKTP